LLPTNGAAGLRAVATIRRGAERAGQRHPIRSAAAGWTPLRMGGCQRGAAAGSSCRRPEGLEQANPTSMEAWSSCTPARARGVSSAYWGGSGAETRQLRVYGRRAEDRDKRILRRHDIAALG
jgi:hypothetical protein